MHDLRMTQKVPQGMWGPWLRDQAHLIRKAEDSIEHPRLSRDWTKVKQRLHSGLQHMVK